MEDKMTVDKLNEMIKEFKEIYYRVDDIGKKEIKKLLEGYVVFDKPEKKLK
jgi:hypothetical protein